MSDEETWRKDYEEDDEPERNCISPSEGTYGDDESKEKYESMESPKRKTRRNVNSVNDDMEEDEGEAPVRRSRARRQPSIENDDQSQERPKSGSRTQRLKSGSSEDERPQQRNRPRDARGSIKERTLSFEQSSDDGSKRNNKRTTSINRDENQPPRRGSQSATSEGEDFTNQSASERRQKWERQASKDYARRDSKPRVFGGSAGASALKSRFENKAVESRKVMTSSDRMRTISGSVDGGEDRQHSALSLKSRFEAKIQDNAPVKRNFVINRNGGGAAKKFGGGAPTSNKCFVCTKTVYPMEKLEADNHVYHKFCFKCKTCNRTVGLGNYAALAGDIYCKPHLKQLFKLKGNYDEGFGREQRKADWIKKDAKPVGEEEDAPVTNGNQSGGEE